MNRIASWLDAVELWVVGLPFVPQFVLMLAVIIPVAFGLAWTLDRMLDFALTRLGRGSDR